MKLLKCSKCGEMKPETEFHKDKTHKSGYRSACKECVKNDKAKKEYQKKYREEHKKYFKEKYKEWKIKNREHSNEWNREWRKKHPEKSKEYYDKNREEILKRSKERRQTEKWKETRKAYTHSPKAKAYKSARKALERGASKNGDKDINLTTLIERDKGICQICGKPIDQNDYQWRDGAFITGMNYPTIDHIKPLNKGGTHTWDNVQLAHFLCNSTKQDKERGD